MVVSRSALRELALLVVLFVGYTASRLLASDNIEAAALHAAEILEVEAAFGLDVEAPLNAWLMQVPGLPLATSFWYASLHYFITPLVLIALWRRGWEAYAPARTALGVATGLALVGYLLYPTAPPRLITGYTDVLAHTSASGWWGAEASAPRGFGEATNQLAAMPSMHVGWAFWVAFVAARHVQRRWVRAAAYAYAGVTSVVVVVTANHWVLDGVVGAVLVLAALRWAGLVEDAVRWSVPGLAVKPSA